MSPFTIVHRRTCISADVIGGPYFELSLSFIWGVVIFHHIPQSLLTEGNERNITFHCQQGVAMTTSHRRHRERVTFIELHWLWYPRILLFSSQAAAGPLAPRVHLPFCREQKQKKKKRMVTKLRVRAPAFINPHRSLTDGSVSPAVAAQWLDLTEIRVEQSPYSTKKAWLASLQGANH